jgi:signal transduction histidine kinase
MGKLKTDVSVQNLPVVMERLVTNIFKNVFRSIPLRLMLIVPFVIQIFGAVGLVGYLSFENGERAVSTLTYRIMDETSDRVQQHLDSYLAIPHQINQLNADAIKRGYFDIQDLKAAGRYFWQQAKTFKSVSWIGYGLPNSKGVGSGTWYNGKDILTDEMYEGKDYGYITDSQGNYTKQVYTDKYNFLTDKWYVDTVKAGKPIWSRTYPQVTELNEYVAASANYPIYDKNNKLIAVVGADLQLLDISKFLQNLKVGNHGKIFIIERDGLLIGNSSSAAIYKKNNNEIRRLKASESSDSLIKSIANYFQSHFGDLNIIQQKQIINSEFNQEKYRVHVTPWHDDYGLDWLVVVALPNSDFMAQIRANTRTSILLCITALVAAIFIGIVTSRWITKPILYLTEASFAIASGNLNQTIQSSHFQEINILAKSFNRMAVQLRTAFYELEATNIDLENRVVERTAELKNMLDKLQKTQSQLIQTEKMSSLGQMIAGIAHEINNPVSFIYGNLTHAQQYTQDLLRLLELYQQHLPNPPDVIQQEIETIELDFIKQDLIKTLKSMQIGSERITEIVLSLRNFSRLDEAEYKQADIHAGIDSTLMILGHRLKPQNNLPKIQVIKKYSVLPQIQCYAGQLNQVFMNLLANAIDALNEGKIAQPQITISTQMIGNKQIQISISDNALGIPIDIQQKLFDPFFTTKPPGKGTGLGLSISYQIITEKHGGSIECISEVGVGTTFAINILYKT